MAAEKRSKSRSVRAASRNISEHPLVIGTEVGVSLPVGDTYAHLRFSFWCEEAIKNDTMAERKRAAERLEEYVEAELDRRVKKAMKVVVRALNGDDDDEDEPKGRKVSSNKVSVRDRAKKRIK